MGAKIFGYNDHIPKQWVGSQGYGDEQMHPIRYVMGYLIVSCTGMWIPYWLLLHHTKMNNGWETFNKPGKKAPGFFEARNK